MAKQLSKLGISTGNTIEPGQITQSIDALTGEDAYDLKISGSLTLSGSVFMETGSIFYGTASVALNALGGSGGVPDGPNTSVQFKDGNSFRGVSNFTYDQNTDTLSAGTGNFTTIIGSVSADSLRTPALINGSPSTRTNSSSSIDPDGFARFVSASIAGFTINTNEIKSSGDLLRLKASGEITASTGFLFGDKSAAQYIQYDGSSLVVRGDLSVDQLFLPALINGAPSDVTNASSSLLSDGFAKFVSASIGGWDITTGSIESPSMMIRPEGLLQTKNFASGQTGWRISAEGNGTAEFENARIRGTLRTTTFEKETVNAVGGQLWVVNSTTLSASVAASDTTMSVANASGFSQGEILMAKKVDNTGFQTEYILVNSASIDGNGSGSDETYGRIMVTRAYGSGSQGDFVGDIASQSQSYSEGQVLVSTAKSGSGFIKLNANPNDVETPFMDITERTGSGIYDVELKARLGDLSGLANSDYVFNRPNPGFGLATDNVFLQGGIKATFGEIGGFGISATTISSSNNDLILRSSGEMTASGGFLFGNKSLQQYVQYDGSSLVVRGDLSVDNIKTPAVINGSPSTFTNASSSIDSQGFARFVSASIGGFEVNTEQIKASNNELVLSSSGEFLAGNKSSNQYVEYDGTNLVVRGNLSVDNIQTPALINGAPSTITNASASITSDGFAKFVSASIAGFTVNTSEIKSSDDSLRLKADGNITASKVLLGDKSGGNFLQFDGSTLTVQGSITADNISTPSNLSGTDVSSSISSDGFALFKSASIGGFDISPSTIRQFTPASSSVESSNVTLDNFTISGFLNNTTPGISNQTYSTPAPTNGFLFRGYIQNSTPNTGHFENGDGNPSSIAEADYNVGDSTITLTNSGKLGSSFPEQEPGLPATAISGFNFYSNSGATVQVFPSSSNVSHPATESILIDAGNQKIVVGGTSGNNLILNGANGTITASAANISGKITADEGTIGGTIIESTVLKSSTNLPSPDGSPAFKLDSDGIISGSDMLLRNVYKVNNVDTKFTLVDTNQGFFIGRNIGRQVVSNNSEITKSYTGSSSYILIYSEVFQLLPFEDKFLLSFTSRFTGINGGVANLQFKLQTMVTGSSTTDTTAYDQWNNDTLLRDFPISFTPASTAKAYSQNGRQSANQIAIPSNVQGETVRFGVWAQVSTSCEAKIKGISLIATNAFASDFQTTEVLAAETTKN